jgi:malonyl-CoA O-methyltransferase
VLEPAGLLMFSTYGPDTLKELRQACAAVDSQSHVQSFVDMHDLGDMLAASGFAAPVMDMDLVTLTYADLAGLLGDLRRTGQTYVGAGRRRALMGRGAWQRLSDAYEAMRRDGRLPATVELVFGHAWKAERTRAPGTAKISVFRPRGPQFPVTG